jgi:tetratricopeptide (TPR) repeat protein
VALRYFLSFFAPTHLSPASDLTPFSGYHVDAVLGLAFLMTLVSVALIVAVSSQWRPAVFGVWWFLLGILPGAALLQPDVEKDTRMFLPFIGLALTLTWTARMLLPSGEPLRRLEAIAAAILLLCMASATYARNRVWSSEEALWRDNVEKNPANIRGLRNYAMVLASTGRNAEAYEYLRKARKLDPRSGEVMAGMGTVAAALNELDLADENFGHARSLAAGQLVGYYPFATWMESRLKNHAWVDANDEFRMRERAVEAYSWAASLAPTDLRPLYGLMRIYSANSDWNNLRKTVEQARAILPQDGETATFATLVSNHPDTLKGAEQLAREYPTPENLMTLSDAYWLAGDFNKCMETAQKALELQPGYARAYNSIGVAYLSMGHLDEAIEAVKKALQSDPDNRMARANLAEWERQKLVVGNSIIRK